MDIILLKQIKSLGNPGEIRSVKRGYAVNFLIPSGFALPAEDGFIKEAQSRVKKLIKAREIELEELKALIGEIEGLEIKIIRKAGKEGKLFGSVKEKDITDEIAKKIGKQIKENYILLEEPIKKIGNYNIEIKGNEDIKAKIKLVIEEEKAGKKK